MTSGCAEQVETDANNNADTQSSRCLVYGVLLFCKVNYQTTVIKSCHPITTICEIILLIFQAINPKVPHNGKLRLTDW